MAQVPVPWFSGAPVGGVSPYMGKAIRARRNLNAITQGLFGVGNFLRQERSQGLPPGATDADMEAEEAKLEGALGDAQSRAHNDSVSPVESAAYAGDPKGAQAIKDDPAGHAAGTHEEKQSFLSSLGNFMKTGTERLLFGDPKRGERMRHIHQMQGELEFEKGRENYLKSIVPLLKVSEDPDAVIRATGGGRWGITSVGKIRAPAGRGTGAGAGGGLDTGIVPPGSERFMPGKGEGGGLIDREFLTQARNNVLQRHHNVLPPEGDTAANESFQNEILAEAAKLKKSYQDGTDKARRDRANTEWEHREGIKHREYLEKRHHQESITGGGSTTETTQTYVDQYGKEHNLDSQGAMQFSLDHPNIRLRPKKETTRVTKPLETPPEKGKPFVDPGPALGAPNFYRND